MAAGDEGNKFCRKVFASIIIRAVIGERFAFAVLQWLKRSWNELLIGGPIILIISQEVI